MSDLLKRAYSKLRKLYFWQPQVIVVTPLRNSKVPPKPFSIKGVVLDKSRKLHSLSRGGTSHHFNVPAEWVQILGEGPFELRLFQTDVKGIIVCEVGGEVS